MKIEAVYKNAAIAIETVKSPVPEKKADLSIAEKGETTNKTIIELKAAGKIVTIVCCWSHFSEDANFSYHWSEDENILFIGAGYVSAVINPLTLTILVVNYPDLFWGWECVNGHILELGELDCRLYTPSGELVGESAVDPPYEYRVTDKAIEFSSIVVGETKIEFKK